jgi:predicted acylesterase/phospholipase RssA/CRP-like cAMP-binding protein
MLRRWKGDLQLLTYTFVKYKKSVTFAIQHLISNNHSLEQMKLLEDYSHYQTFLEQLFGEITEEQVQQVFSIAETLHFEAGQYLFQEGDADNALYIVLSGRLRALHRVDDNIRILGDVSAGEPVGELALFTKEPRSASVIAIRKSTVLQIDEADYITLIAQYPLFANTLTQFVINRLRRNAFQQRMASAPKNIAIVKLQPDFDLSPWTEEIKRQLADMNVDIHVYYTHDQPIDNPNTIFEEIENSKGINFIVCDDQHHAWANQCITYCDLVLVVTDFYAPSALYPIEAHLNLYSSDILNKKTYLLLLHPENAPLPTQTRRWFEERRVDLHLHLRKNNLKDIRRFSRIITNRAIGLVLGGGGAKGFAHIGAVQAMMKAGIEFDFVGGTSAGALFGMILTFSDFNMPHLDRICQRGVESKVTSNDYHFPFLSLMSGRKVRRYLKEIFDETHLEDFWITSYCVSTNYSNATLKVHETGLARQQIEASIAIPGVFPPVIIDRHLHVDGGVMDNLPIEAMYRKPVRHIIAISLSAQSAHLVDIETPPSAWSIFVNKITKKRRFRLPTMATVLINSLTLNSSQKQEITKSQAALYLEMDLRGFGFLDWSQWQKLVEKGYQQTQNYLEELPQTEHFWKN